MPDTLLGRLLSVLAIFSTGVVVGMLHAPQSGDATRRQLAGSARDAADAARTAATDLAEPIAESARDRARTLAQRHVPLSGDLDFDARDIFDDLGSGRG
ncbi:hypothetical protein [Rubrivirga sp. IMCC45206]|uniref:hypothetical protein n=1 Tax=Rubrivirga sp. IMCC45206 TaxID=3391614 RepID=UPI00398FDBC3